ncbi:hypothetical protein [Pseudophaeobacter sp.]|uniref:hypothetical protein n=1 Tax=Pseudophaeobacter sp. TaxID=1971739 RepID=UPI003296A0C7
MAEIEDFNLTRLNGRIAVPTPGGTRLELGVLHDGSDAETEIGGAPSDDTYRAARQYSLQFGMVNEARYLGLFAADGDVRFNPSDADQDADFSAWGLTGQWQLGDFSLGGQAGLLDTQADNPETLSDAGFIAANLSYFLDEKTRFSARAAYASGDQDTDSSSAPDPIDLVAFGLEVERSFALGSGRHAASIYGTVDWINVREGSSFGSVDEVSDLAIGVGIRIVFGAGSSRDSERAFAPRLPQFTRWIGAVPAVD